MELVPESEFVQRSAQARMIGFPGFASTLAFEGDQEYTLTWIPVGRSTDLPTILQSATILASGDGGGSLYRKGGGTWYESDDPPMSNLIINRVVQLLRVPQDFAGALSFAVTEWPDCLLVMSAFFVWGWSTGEDLYFIPHNGSCILMTSHHGVLTATFPNTAARDLFHDGMQRLGYHVQC